MFVFRLGNSKIPPVEEFEGMADIELKSDCPLISSKPRQQWKIFFSYFLQR
jgi:hypothetical protein